MLIVIRQMMMRASDMSNMKYILPYVFMTGNDNDLDKEQTMKMIQTMTKIQRTTTRRRIMRNMLIAIPQTTMRASDMSNMMYI